MSSRTRSRRPLLIGLAVAVVLALIAAVLLWRDRAGGGDEEAEQLARALSSGDFASVALDEQDAHETAEEWTRIVKPLSTAIGEKPEVTVAGVAADDGRRTATLSWSWPLSHGADPWTYTTQASLERDGDHWAATVEPDTIAPGLGESAHLELRTAEPRIGQVTDRDGHVLYGPHEVRVLGIDKTQVDQDRQDAAATRLAQLLGIDEDRFTTAVEDAGSKAFVPALTVRKEELGNYPLDRAKETVPGYHAIEKTQPLAVDKQYAPGVLGSLHEATAEDVEKGKGEVVAGDLVGSGGVVGAKRDQLVGTPERRIVAAGGTKEKTLHTVEGTPGKDVEITLDPDLQETATAAIADQDSPSAVIVMQPSTGKLLASALGPTGGSYPIGLVGHYAPGSTFKSVTALALLRAGDTPETTLECPKTATVEGRSYKNADSMDPGLFGRMSLADAIAHSCNTAMLLQYEKVSQPELARAATTLGIGQDAPEGLDAYLGSVDPKDSGGEHAADMMGQGRVLASPLTMATVLSSIQHGSTVKPRILADDDSAAPEVKKPLTAEETQQLQGLLRGVVTRGSLHDFQDVPGKPVIGKTGTAEWTDQDGELKLHSWVIVAQGDVVVAAFVEDGGYGATTAGPIAKKVLEAAG